MNTRISSILPVLMASAAILSAPAALVDAGLDYRDATNHFVRPACGTVSGGWRTAETNGNTAVLSFDGYSTPMWDLRLFSGGNPFSYETHSTRGSTKYTYFSRGGILITTSTNLETGATSVTTNRFVGAADIPIDSQTLDAWRQTLSNTRANGGLVSPRFAYDCNGITGCEPSDFSMVLTHIRQISAVLNEYADVVLSIECGMIGQYGEMHTSPYDDWEYAPQILRTWLAELDPRIQVQVRSPKYYFRLLADCHRASDLLARQDEFDPDRRLGLYDDGYLGTIYNYGTYNGFATDGGINGFNRKHGVDYLRDRPHIPYGGECAGVSAEAAAGVLDNFASREWNLVEEWYATHLSYLRGIVGGVGETLRARSFHATEYAFPGMPSLAEWDSSSLADFLRAHMGYRFVLRGSRLSATSAPGGTLELSFDIENTGFSDLSLPTKTEVLLQSSADRFWACPVSIDLGSAVPSTSNATLSVTLQLPSSLSEGDWNVYLRTHVVVEGDSPSAAGLRTVRFANPSSQWNAAIAGNLLGTVHVEGTASTPGLGFLESGGEGRGALAPQLVLSALPANAALPAELADWSGAALCVYAPGASNIRYLRGGTEIPSTNGVAALPEGLDALGLWSVVYEITGTTVMRDLLVLSEDAGAGHVWRLETRNGHLRRVCDDCGAERDPAPGFDRELPGRPLASLPETNAVLTFATASNPFGPDPPCNVLYPAFTVSGVPVGGARLGDLVTSTAPPGSTGYISSNSSGNLNDRNDASYDPARQSVAIPADGAYLTDIKYTLVNWLEPYRYGTVREFSLNNPAASRGGRSSGLENAELATLGLFTADPRYHVWFCDEDWTVLCETNGVIAGNLAGNFHSIPIPAATSLFSGTPPAEFASTDALCRQFHGWKRLDGATPGWALGSVALVPDYHETAHEWETADSDGFGRVTALRCTACGRQLTLPGLVRWFDVGFERNGYRLGSDWDNLAGVDETGSWERPADDASVLQEAEGGGRVLSLHTLNSPVWYTPSEASSNGFDVVVEGHVTVHPLASTSALPAVSSGGLAFLEAEVAGEGSANGIAVYGHAADGWRRIHGVDPETGDWVVWRMEIDLASADAPRIRYRIDNVALTDGENSEWLPLATDIDCVTGVGFLGQAFVGDFRGTYAEGGGQGTATDPPPPAFGSGPGAPALEFVVDPDTGAPRLVVRISNAVADVWYTAFTSETLDGPYMAEAASTQAPADGGLSLVVDATPTAKFLIVVASDAPFTLGAPLP